MTIQAFGCQIGNFYITTLIEKLIFILIQSTYMLPCKKLFLLVFICLIKDYTSYFIVLTFEPASLNVALAIMF